MVKVDTVIKYNLRMPAALRDELLQAAAEELLLVFRK